MASSAAIIRSREAAAALLHPERQRILELLQEQPNSASGLARQLRFARQRLNYHLKELESAGLVTLLEERRKGNCTERVLQATAQSYYLSPDVLGKLAEHGTTPADAFSSAYLIRTAGRAMRDLAVLQERAKAAQQTLATLTLEAEIHFASASERHAFATELANTVAALAAKYHQPNAMKGRSFRLFAGIYPAIDLNQENQPA